MNSLAMTDSLLLVVTMIIAIGAKYPEIPTVDSHCSWFICSCSMPWCSALYRRAASSNDALFFLGPGCNCGVSTARGNVSFLGFRACQSMALLEYLCRYCRRTWPCRKRARVWSLGECGRAYLGRRARLAIDYFSRCIGNSWRGVATHRSCAFCA